jgi:dimethylamine monooxygenase subunit A
VDETIPYRPFVGGPFRWRLGLRPLDTADWIEIRADHEAQMAAKAAVLADHHDTAVVVADDVVPEADEVLEVLVSHLRERFPDRYGHVEADRLLHPLDAAGRLVQEDLVLLVERNGELVVGGGSVCFPNRWDLRSKLGRTMAEVHEPVARLNEQLAGPIDGVLERLRPERSFWRLGWGVLDTGELYQAVDGTASPRPGAAHSGVAHSDAGGFERLSLDQIHLRVERETLRRFPRTGCILFTIRTHTATLRQVAARPADAALLAEAIAAMPDDVAGYKQLDSLGSRVIELLGAA